MTRLETKNITLKNASDQFFRDGKKEIDFILVYDKTVNISQQEIRNSFHRMLIKRGLEIEFENNATEDGKKFKFVKIHAPEEMLQHMAEMYRLKLPLRSDEHPVTFPKTWFEQVLHCKIFSLPEKYTKRYEVHPNYFARFRESVKNIFLPYSATSFFHPGHRIQFVYEILCATEIEIIENDVKKIEKSPGIERLLKEKVYLAAYPLHDGGITYDPIEVKDIPVYEWNMRRLLRRYWSDMRNLIKHQPMLQIQHYYGLTVAVYFAWLGCYTRALIPLSIIGVISFLYGLSSFTVNSEIVDVCEKHSDIWMCPYCFRCMPWRLGDSCFLYRATEIFANKAMPVYAILVCVWSSWFLVYWQRKQAELNWDWQDAAICSVQDRIRFEYIDKSSKVKKRNPITNQFEPYVDKRIRDRRKLFSLFIVIVAVLVVIFIMTVIITARVHVIIFLHNAGVAALVKDGFTILGTKIGRLDRFIAALICASLSIIIVMIADISYEILARKLTDNEIPRTMSDYEKSYIYKTICFEVINYYGAMIYLAVFKGAAFHGPIIEKQPNFLEGKEYCDPGGCMSELTVQVIVLLFVKQFFHYVMQLIWPIVQQKYRQSSKYVWKTGKDLKQWEKDLTLVQPPDLQLTAEFEEAVVQFGIICLFSVAFPLLPLLTLFTNLLEIRFDARKWTDYYRRPVPHVAKGIGPWLKIIRAISLVSIAVNGIIVVFTSELVQQFVYLNVFSANFTFEGYLLHQLTEYNLTGREHLFSYDLPTNSCFFGGYHESEYPYKLNQAGWQVRMTKWMCFAVFIIFVGLVRRAVRIFTPTVPKKLDIEIRREHYHARQLLIEAEKQNFQIKHPLLKSVKSIAYSLSTSI